MEVATRVGKLLVLIRLPVYLEVTVEGVTVEGVTVEGVTVEGVTVEGVTVSKHTAQT